MSTLQARAARFLLSLGCVLLLVANHPHTAPCATLTVAPGDTTLQAAMLQAAPGDSLVLLPGNYVLSQSLAIRPGITLTSLGGAAQTIVVHSSAASFQNVFDIINAAPPPTIDGLTIAHGWDPSGRPGGGIFVQNCDPVIRNNVITANVTGGLEGGGGRGAAIGIAGGQPTISHNTIVANFCDYGAVDLYQCSAVVEFNLICYTGVDTSGNSGMGISCNASGAARVSHNLLWRNYYANLDPLCASNATLDSNVVADPRFCTPVFDPRDPVLGDWRVASNSPAAPGGAAAGWGAPLGICPGTSAATQTTWGKVKATYR